MEKARVAIFEGNEDRRKMLLASFARKSYLGHKIIAEVLSKNEAEDFINAKRPFDVAIIGGSLAAQDKNHKVERDIVKLIHKLPFQVVVVSYTDESLAHDGIALEHEFDQSQIWEMPEVIKSLKPLTQRR